LSIGVRLEARRAPALVRRPSRRFEKVFGGVGIDDRIVDAARTLEPGVVRMLDAIYMATALAVGDDLEAVVTYDQRTVEVAKLVGDQRPRRADLRGPSERVPSDSRPWEPRWRTFPSISRAGSSSVRLISSERNERQPHLVAAVLEWLLQRRIHDVGHGRHEHMEHVVAVKALGDQAACGGPRLRRLTIPELAGDDLVEGEVESWVDRFAIDLEALVAPEGTREPGMLGLDEGRPIVRIGRIEQRQVDPVNLATCRGNGP
jgi:hypothetical protein